MSRLAPMRASPDSGAYAILYAMLVVALFGTASLVVDIANLRENRSVTRSAADSAVLAGAGHLSAVSAASSNPLEACKAAWAYLRVGLPSLPDGSSSCSNALFPSAGTGCSAATTPRIATYTDPKWTVHVTWPVLANSRLMLNPDSAPADLTQRANDAVDGLSPCPRIAVEVYKTDKLGFAALFGVGDASTRAASVGRSVALGEISEDIAALNILEQDKCEVLTTNGNGSIDVNGFGQRAGIIAIESSGNGGNPLCNGSGAVIHPNSTANNYIHANGADGTAGAGLIEAYAQNPPPAGAQDRSDIITNGNNVSPAPTTLTARSGTTPVTRLYDCAVPASCGPGGGPYITQLKATYGTAAAKPTVVPSTLGAWRVLPGDPETPSGWRCNGTSSTPPAVLSMGNWYIDCPSGLKTQTSIIFKGGRVVSSGTIDVQGGCFAINVNTNTCPTLTPATPTTPAIMTPGPSGAAALLYIGGNGNLTSGSTNAKVFLPQTFTFIKDGHTALGGGTDSSLYMTTPLASGTPLKAIACAALDLACSFSIFSKLALWSEGLVDHDIGGQAAMGLRGVLYTPNARTNLSGQASSSQQQAQFWTKSLNVGGNAGVVMVADPDASIARPTSGVALIR